MLRLGILCSGQLGETTLHQVYENFPVAFVMTDKNSRGIVSFCNEKSIPVFTGNPRKGRGFKFARQFDVEVIASINYMFLIENDVIGLPSKLAFNIHGALLPKYRGRTPHVWAIINNEEVVGITAHKIDAGCDTGDIIEQVVIPLDDYDTGATVLKKYATKYYPLVSTVLAQVAENCVQTRPQDHSKATCFPKRTPDDGEINWDWCRERIRNWVRAQACPYPGAFTFYHDQKVIIDKISFCDCGFDDSTSNGAILNASPTIVKTPNGAVKLDVVREKMKFVVDNMFSSRNPSIHSQQNMPNLDEHRQLSFEKVHSNR